MGKQGSILESLSDLHQINEATSNFSAKLNTVIGSASKGQQDFIKKFLNSIYLGIMKEYGGYIEGKRPIVKDMKSYKYITWKMQTNQSTHYNSLHKFVDSMGTTTDMYIGGEQYTCMVLDQDGKVVKDDNSYSSEGGFSIEKNPFVGYRYAWGKNEKVDVNVAGDTFKFVVSVPNLEYIAWENPDVTKDIRRNKYVFNGKDFNATYDAGEREFIIRTGKDIMDQYNILYKKSPKAEKAFSRLYSVFTKDMDKASFESILKEYGVRYEHSWYSWD